MKSHKILIAIALASQLLSGVMPTSFASANELHLSQLTILGGASSAENPMGQPDGNLALSLDDGQSWGPAYLAGSSSHTRGYGYRAGTDSWLNCTPNSNPCPGNAPETIRSTFVLPDQFSNLGISINALIDDTGYFSLNGHQFWVVGVGAQTFDLTDYAIAGANNLDVKVVNGSGEVGINFRYDISALTNGDITQIQTRYVGSFAGTPKILGDTISGQTIEARFTQPSIEATLNYQWLSDGVEIPGANSKFFTLTQNEVDKNIQVRIEIFPANPRYLSETKFSEQVSVEDGSTVKFFTILGGKSDSENPFGGPDKNLSVSTDNGASWGPAFISANSYLLSALGAVPGTDAWVNCQPNAGGCPTEIIQSKFLLPEGSTNVKLRIFAQVDDRGEFYLNGNLLLTCDAGNCLEGRDVVLGDSARTGLNVIQLKIQNFGGEMGVNFKYRFTFKALENATLVAPRYSFASVQAPTVAGSHKVGELVSASIPSLPGLATPAYSWLRDGVAIQGATQASYRLTSDDVGKRLSFRLTLSANNYDDLVVTSLPVLVHGLIPERNPENGHYYQYIPYSGNWYEALRYARTLKFNGMRGHLSTITSASENDFVTSIADGNVISLPSHQVIRDGKKLWVWTDGPENGQTFSYCESAHNCAAQNNAYSNWDLQFNQPDMINESILIMRTRSNWSQDGSGSRISSGVWGDCGLNCAQGFVVEFDSSWNLFLEDDVIKAGSNHYYQLVKNSLNYSDALSQSKSSNYRGLRGHLVTVESSSENSLVSMLAAGNVFWVAGRDIGNSNSAQRNWVWDDGPNVGKQFLTCLTSIGCFGSSYEYTSWGITASYVNGSGTWKSAIQSGYQDSWGTWNDCAPTLDQCSQVNSYIVEYELDPKLSLINQSGDWVNLSSNFAFPGEEVLVTSHFESTSGTAKVVSSGNSPVTLASPDEFGNASTSVSFASAGMKNVILSQGRKKLLVQIWVPKVTVSKRSLKLGGNFTVSINAVKPGALCRLATSDGRQFESTANLSAKCSFVVTGTKVGSLSFTPSAGDLNLDSQGVTVLR